MATKHVTAVSAVILLVMLIAAPVVMAAGNAKEGRKLATTRKLGNCISCHHLPDVQFPGDVGPDLVDVMQDTSDRAEVRKWIYDARDMNEETIMPPFGANKILTRQQIDDIVEYLFSLKKAK